MKAFNVQILAAQAMLLILSSSQPCRGQYPQDYGQDQSYGVQGYETYHQPAYDPGTSYYQTYAYGYPAHGRAATPEESSSDSAIMAAMSPLNNVVSSIAAQPVVPTSLIALVQPPSLPKSAAPSSADVPVQKKSNCTTGCAAAKLFEAKSQEPHYQPSQNQLAPQQNHGQNQQQQSQITPCQCPCWTYGAYPYYQNSYHTQYSKGSPNYHRPRISYRQYRPNYAYQGYYTRPVYSSPYYDPNYNRGYIRH